MDKLFDRFCPVCGECDNLRQLKILNPSSIRIERQCPNKHRWAEDYTLSYQGYTYDHKSYDQYGQEVKEYEQS